MLAGNNMIPKAYLPGHAIFSGRSCKLKPQVQGPYIHLPFTLALVNPVSSKGPLSPNQTIPERRCLLRFATHNLPQTLFSTVAQYRCNLADALIHTHSLCASHYVTTITPFGYVRLTRLTGRNLLTEREYLGNVFNCNNELWVDNTVQRLLTLRLVLSAPNYHCLRIFW